MRTDAVDTTAPPPFPAIGRRDDDRPKIPFAVTTPLLTLTSLFLFLPLPLSFLLPLYKLDALACRRRFSAEGNERPTRAHSRLYTNVQTI